MNTSTIAPPKNKIAAKTITIDRVEGPHALCFKTGHATWKDAEERVQHICQSAPKSGGYDKVAFSIVFEDGENYTGRLDCAHPGSKAYEGTLADHIRGHLTFGAGLHKPSHMTDADYDRIMAEREKNEPGSKDRFLAFLKTYALEDLAPEQAAPTDTTTKYCTILGDTRSAIGLLRMLGGIESPDGSWAVPAEKYAEAQAAVNRFNPPTKAAAPVVMTVTLQGKPIPPQILAAAKAVAAAPRPAPKPTKTTTKKGPKQLPPTALARRLEALLTGAVAVGADIPDQRGPVYGAIANAVAAIERAIDAMKE